MRCRSAEARMQELLDQRLDPALDAELLEHAAVCSECCKLLELQGELLVGLAGLRVPKLPNDFSRRVVGSVVRPQRAAQRFAPTTSVLAIVAMLFLVFGLWSSQDRSAISGVGNELAKATSHGSSAQRRGATLSIADIDSGDLRVAFEQFVVQLASNEGARFQVDQFAGTIRPLASTLNVAFDAIRRSIPGRRQPAHGEPQARESHGFRFSRVI